MSEELRFNDRMEFRRWLSETNPESSGVWIVFSRNDDSSLSALEALEEALSFGWIDGLIKRIDDRHYKKYFAPRKKGSRWSERNKEIIERLIESGTMTLGGLVAIQRAKDDGSWEIADRKNLTEQAYRQFESRIRGNARAFENFAKMPKSI